jgi:ATP-dependent Lon protease
MAAPNLNFPPDFCGEVRLFPLSELVMFPSNVLPLHIFESRYKEMLEDALRGDQLVAMATLMPGYEHDYYSRPPVCPSVCIGRVIAHQRTPQGTYNLMLAGLERAKIEHEIEPVRSFRRGKVTVIGSRTAKAKTASAERAEQLVAQIVKIFPAMRRLFEELSGHEIPLAALTDVVAFHLPLKMELKLQLLAETDPTLRAELLLANYPWTESLESDSGRYRGDFRAN